MTRIAGIVVVVTTMVLLGGCRSEPVARSTPAPSVGPAGQVPAGVLPPVDRSRDAVDQLNELQDQTEQRTGGSGYTTP